MAEKLRKLEILRVFGSDAMEMIEARERAITVHHTSDIDAAGSEIEEAVRRVLRRKLPTSFYTGHGHVVDATLSVSPQLDLIIADNAAAPILFRTENGTEYFPFESVYAFGEVKSTYYHSKRYVGAFVEVIRSVRQNLSRGVTPPSYVGGGLNLGAGFSVTEKRPFRNPLFKFMVFVNGGDFSPTQIDSLYRETPMEDLPNLICILDRGIVVNALIVAGADGKPGLGPLQTIPEFSLASTGAEGRWMFIPFGHASDSAGSNFAVLWFALVTHLRGTVLLPPDMLGYLGHLITYGSGTVLG